MDKWADDEIRRQIAYLDFGGADEPCGDMQNELFLDATSSADVERLLSMTKLATDSAVQVTGERDILATKVWGLKQQAAASSRAWQRALAERNEARVARDGWRTVCGFEALAIVILILLGVLA